MARRTKDEAIKTRNAILNAAERVFFRRGVARTSLDEIAKAAKVTRGAVYWHFKDKIAVFEAMMQRVFLPQEEVLQKLVERGSDTPLNDLQDACVDALCRMGSDKRRQRVISIMLHRCEYVEDMGPVLKRRRECKDRMLAQSMKMLEQAAKLKQLSPQWTPRLAALTLQSLINGLINNALEGRKSFDLVKVAPDCIDGFFRSLRKN